MLENLKAQLQKVMAMFQSLRSDPRIVLLVASQQSIGSKMSSKGNEVTGCVETWNNIYKKAFGVKFSQTLSTITMISLLLNSKRFVRVPLPIPGDTIISVTNGPRVGHIGIFNSDGTIISNDSSTGCVATRYNYDSWYARYSTGMGLETYIFRIIQ